MGLHVCFYCFKLCLVLEKFKGKYKEKKQREINERVYFFKNHFTTYYYYYKIYTFLINFNYFYFYFRIFHNKNS